MSHLGDRVAALVDGQLPIEATERAHAHLAHCRPCRDEVEAERLMKARLTQLSGPEPGCDLVNALLAMGGPSGPLRPRDGHVPGSPRPPAVSPWSASPDRPALDATALLTTRLVRPGGSLRPPGRSTGSTGSTGPRRPADRPAGRSVARQWTGGGTSGRVKLAGALLGALSVVGAGVTGLALVGAATPASPASPASRTSLDTMLSRQPVTDRRSVATSSSTLGWQTNGGALVPPQQPPRVQSMLAQVTGNGGIHQPR